MFDSDSARFLSSARSLVRIAVLAMLASPAAGYAQDRVGSCERGTASRVLDPNLVEAEIFNTGTLFFDSEEEARYIVPKGSGKSPIYSAALWVAGEVDDELRAAAANYWPTDPVLGCYRRRRNGLHDERLQSSLRPLLRSRQARLRAQHDRPAHLGPHRRRPLTGATSQIADEPATCNLQR